MPAVSAPRASRAWPLPVAVMAVAAAGAWQIPAFVHTAWWPLPLLAAGVFAAALSGCSPRRAAFLGWLFGTVWLAGATWWLFVSMHRYGGLPAWMAALAVFALSALLSLYLAFSCAAFAAWRRGTPAADALLFAAGWLLAELARGVFFTGFPWAASGYAQIDGPLAQLAPLVGAYGIGAVAAGLSAWAAFAALQRRPTGALAAAAVLGVLGILPATVFTRPSGTLSVALVQGNIPQEEKFASAHQAEALQWHLQALRASAAELTVAPETAVPFLPQQFEPGFWTALEADFSARHTHVLFGVPLGDDAAGYTNSAAGYGAGAAPYRYDKHHLVPFGEFIPPGFRWFTRMMNIPLGDFARGGPSQPSFVVHGERVAPNICYEDLFGEELAARFGVPGAAPTVFANLSNIGWFGDTAAIAQHLQISRMRAREFERPMLRATNTGATAVIDHRGRVVRALPPLTRGVLQARVQGRAGTTLFAWWASRFGLWPLWLGAAGVVLMAAWRRRMKEA